MNRQQAKQLGQAIKVYKIIARLTDCEKGIANGQLATFLVQEYSFCEAVQFIENHYRDWAYFTVEIVSVEIVTDPLLSVDIKHCKEGAE